MGYSISWIAFHGLTKGEVLSRTQLIDTAEPDEANESPASGSEPPESFSFSEFQQAQDKAGGQLAEADHMFEAPVELARLICGYRHDRWKFDWGQPSFTKLSSSAPS